MKHLFWQCNPIHGMITSEHLYQNITQQNVCISTGIYCMLTVSYTGCITGFTLIWHVWTWLYKGSGHKTWTCDATTDSCWIIVHLSEMCCETKYKVIGAPLHTITIVLFPDPLCMLKLVMATCIEQSLFGHTLTQLKNLYVSWSIIKQNIKGSFPYI